MRSVQNGLGIWMRGMNSIKIEDEFAILGGGIENGEVIRQLWAAGKQTSKRSVRAAPYPLTSQPRPGAIALAS